MHNCWCLIVYWVISFHLSTGLSATHRRNTRATLTVFCLRCPTSQWRIVMAGWRSWSKSTSVAVRSASSSCRTCWRTLPCWRVWRIRTRGQELAGAKPPFLKLKVKHNTCLASSQVLYNTHISEVVAAFILLLFMYKCASISWADHRWAQSIILLEKSCVLLLSK